MAPQTNTAEPVELHLPQDLSLSVSVLSLTYSPILPLLVYILYSQYVPTKAIVGHVKAGHDHCQHQQHAYENAPLVLEVIFSCSSVPQRGSLCHVAHADMFCKGSMCLHINGRGINRRPGCDDLDSLALVLFSLLSLEN
ncbi:hypothetical protein VNO78_23567 [Psophocarpus tetragonolobus]|uniref:Uncharacterized protein n=1 Tax=Psophocarpus tetragonolobus TaxID=3891 RepID=A0AAN9XDX0_PSOTE